MASEQAKDLAAGTMAGLTSKIIEYPFDTVKVCERVGRSYGWLFPSTVPHRMRAAPTPRSASRRATGIRGC